MGGALPPGRVHVIGIGEDGWHGLRPVARHWISKAEVIIGAPRHFALCDQHIAGTRTIAFPPVPESVIPLIKEHRGKTIVVLTTGDPLWYSIGERIAKTLDHRDQWTIAYHPNVSAFQWAAARMHWSLTEVEAITIHGRPLGAVIPALYPGAKVLVLTSGVHCPQRIAALLVRYGFGQSRMVVLGSLGAARESRLDGYAGDWAGNTALSAKVSEQGASLHTLAIEVIPDKGTPVVAPGVGVVDAAFAHDGTVTKFEIRVITVARLMPMRGALLWDIGCGSATIAVEWLRAAPQTRAIGFEPCCARRALARRNADYFGVSRLQLVATPAPEGLYPVPPPDAVFIGGGLSEAVFNTAWRALKPNGRLVMNAVTVDSEALLMQIHKAHGGTVRKLTLGALDTLHNSRHKVWRSHLTTVQLSLVKKSD